MKGIKNCPFCGSEGVVLKVKLPDNEKELIGIGCINPYCIVGLNIREKTFKLLWAASNEQEAIDAWNKRA